MSAPVSQLTRVNVLLNAEEGERFAAYCVQHGCKKSTLIARLVRDFLDRGEDAPPLIRRRPRAARKENAA